MNILFLTRRFYPDIGGVEKHVLEIGKRLVLKGNKVSVVTQSQGKESSIDGIGIIRLPQSLSKKEIWKLIWKNRNLIKDADVIHAHDVYFWYFPFRILFPFKKSFVTFHGYESYPILKRAIIVRKISEKLSNGNIIVGKFIKKWYKTKPNFVIYGGVDLPKKQTKTINENSAVFIGRLDEHTGVLEYAKAVDLIRKQNPKFEFKIIGDGKYKNQLRKYKPLGFKSDSIEHLKQYNFAFVSRYLSILEALANKRLVFALYDNPVKEDYLKMSLFAKFIIISNDPIELSEKVIYYLNNPKEANKLIDNGYEWVKNESWDRIVKSYQKLWNRNP